MPDRANAEFSVKAMLVAWWLLLLPWFPLAMYAGMAFDGGNTTSADLFAWSL